MNYDFIFGSGFLAGIKAEIAEEKKFDFIQKLVLHMTSKNMPTYRMGENCKSLIRDFYRVRDCVCRCVCVSFHSSNSK